MLITLGLIFLIITTLDQTQGFENDEKDLYISEINESSFEVYWNSEDFGNAATYTVVLNKIEGCTTTDYAVMCKISECSFTLSEYCSPISPCTDVTVEVTGNGIKSEELKFKTAPHASELQNMTFQVNGTVATVSWDSESNNEDSSCATRAKVNIKVKGVTKGEQIVDTVPGQTNNLSKDLDPCDVGEVDAFITYVSGDLEYDTSARYHVRADDDLHGVGIEEPPVTRPVGDSCSLQATWNASVCKKVDNYLLTWDDGDFHDLTVTDTRYTIHGLKPGDCTVCVSAYYDSSLIGEIFCSYAYVEQDCTPDPTETPTDATSPSTSPSITTEPTGATSTVTPTTKAPGPSTETQLFDDTKEVLDDIQGSYDDLKELIANITATTIAPTTTEAATTTVSDDECVTVICRNITITMDNINDLTSNVGEWTVGTNNLTALKDESNYLEELVTEDGNSDEFKDDAEIMKTKVTAAQEDLDDKKKTVENKIQEIKQQNTNSIILVSVIGTVGGLIIIALIGTSAYAFIAKRKKDRKVGLDGPAAAIHLKELDRPQDPSRDPYSRSSQKIGSRPTLSSNY